MFLFTYANERGNDRRYLRNLPEERRTNKAALRAASDAYQLELIELSNATISETIEECQRNSDRIEAFHFGGHADGKSLLFERSDGTTIAAPANPIAELLGGLDSLKLVFLNGCETRAQAEALLAQGVPVVVATSVLVRDDVATRFAFYFYSAIGHGEMIATAFRRASSAAVLEFTAGSLDTQIRAPDALYRDINAAQPFTSIPLPWDLLYTNEAATLYRFVPKRPASDPPQIRTPRTQPVGPLRRELDTGRFRKVGQVVRRKALLACLIAIAVAAVFIAAVSLIGTRRRSISASQADDALRDRMEIEDRSMAEVWNKEAHGHARDEKEREKANGKEARADNAKDTQRHAQNENDARSHAKEQKPTQPPRTVQGHATQPHATALGQQDSLGDLDKEIIRRHIKYYYRDRIRSCYETQRLLKPMLAGTVTARFLITSDGTVASSTASGLDSEVSSCVAWVIKDIEFPKFGGSVQATYPFHFAPSND